MPPRSAASAETGNCAGEQGQDRAQPREELAQHDLGDREVGRRHLRRMPRARSWQIAPAVAAGATRSTIVSWMPASAEKNDWPAFAGAFQVPGRVPAGAR